MLNFQVFQDSSPEICAAYGDVPTIAIDIIQPPCQIAFMGANNREAGRLGGAKLGEYAKTNWDCDYHRLRLARVDRRGRRQHGPHGRLA